MTDRGLRQLKRQAATGGVHEQAALLRARVRAGDLRRIECEKCKGTGAGGPLWTHGQMLEHAGVDVVVSRHLTEDAYLGPDGKLYCSPRVYQAIGDVGLNGKTDLRGLCPECQGTGYRPFSAAVELAAYCRSEAARLVLGQPWFGKWICGKCDGVRVRKHTKRCPDRWELEAWLEGLGRWGQAVQVRAACAAARVALPIWWAGHTKNHGGGGCCFRPERALEAVEAWLESPNKEHKEACDIGGLPDAFNALVSMIVVPHGPSGGNAEAAFRVAIASFAIMAGKQPVREAICSALVAWALAC